MKYTKPRLYFFGDSVKHGECVTGSSAKPACNSGSYDSSSCVSGGSATSCNTGQKAMHYCYVGNIDKECCSLGNSAKTCGG